ncbi:hypothetical protein ACI65C_009722 [Semiaphis heraclei]
MSLKAEKAPGNDLFLTRELLVALLVLFFTVVLFILWKKSRKTNRDVLLVGLCDSGKTALFSYLVYNKPIQSFTSQVENIGEFRNKKNLLRLVDIPGHERVLLYRILTDVTIQTNKTKIIILCNKQDKVLAKGSEVIKTLLEKELDTLRLTKSNQLESIDGKKNKTLLGKKKKHFEFTHCQMPVEFAEVISSSQDIVVEPIKDWLESIQ